MSPFPAHSLSIEPFFISTDQAGDEGTCVVVRRSRRHAAPSERSERSSFISLLEQSERRRSRMREFNSRNGECFGSNIGQTAMKEGAPSTW